MAIKQLGFVDLIEIDDGVMKVAVEAALKRAAADCIDRPALKKSRSVTLKLSVVPVVDDSGDCSEVKYGFEVVETIPKRGSRQYVFGLRKNGVLTANPDALDNHRQNTFDLNEGETL